MPSTELNEPLVAPVDGWESEEARLQVPHAERGARRGTTLRDPQGRLIYPNYVPPGVETPGPSPLCQNLSFVSALEQPLSPGPTTPIDAHRKSSSLPVFNQRPRLGQSSTCNPARNERQPSAFLNFPTFKRAGTDIFTRKGIVPEDTRDSISDDGTSDSPSSSETENPDTRTDRPKGRSRGWPKPDPSGDKYRRFQAANDLYTTKGKVSKRDGRLNITLSSTRDYGYLAKAFGAAVKKVVRRKSHDASQRPAASPSSPAAAITPGAGRRPPRLNIVIMVIGSRGDAQPFLRLGSVLKEYGHRVRIATHPAFREFVENDSKLEFFSVGGDPSELMAFMVKNPGMIPTIGAVKAGDIGRRRAAMAEMFEGFWRACINATDNEKDTQNLKMMGQKDPFVADAIIANPPSFAHIHCAEALGIPLHLMFTFPYTPTQAFPHPLASIKKSNVDPGYTNLLSYPLVETMIWQGLGDLVNEFRVKTLGLDPVSTLWAPGATYRLHVPFTYLWSPGLVPKPDDWGPEIDVSGFVFLDLASSYEPPESLVKFLDAGEAPIYVGFGSVVVDDADQFTDMVFRAVEQAGVRALVSKGWGGLGQENIPEDIYLLDNVPHDWLFPRVRACVIHGGAGTTAIALKCGKPIMIVPFFGDQFFWGPRVSDAGAGPVPVPYKKLSVEALADGIRFCTTSEAVAAAQNIARSIELEGDGAKNAVDAFHRNLPLSGKTSMRCSILDGRVAVWRVKGTVLKLSAVAADIAVSQGLVPWRKLRLIRHKEWNDFEGPGEPITGVAGSLMKSIGGLVRGIGNVPYRLAKTSYDRAKLKKKKKAKKSRRRNDAVVEPSSGFPFPEGGDGNTGPTVGLAEDARKPTATTPGSVPLEPAPEEYFNDIREGVGDISRSLVHVPADFFLALARGFHNAPRLYGDDTVRRPIRITGIRSGLKAAGYEFFYGIYDGFTGIVRLPVRGAKNEGVRGAFLGVGMGLTGFVLKDVAAVVGPIGYVLQGIVKQVEGKDQPMKYLRRAHIVQAQRELRALSEAERKTTVDTVLKGWHIMNGLAEAITQQEGKRRLIPRIGGDGSGKNKSAHILRRHGHDPIFENVRGAEKALDAVNRGEDIGAVLAKHRGT
ncbi:glycosyltransferase family 1 protein [Durotheca rogersii]|uniref:glycosyltransferase family 1 protein n=1 Tax=Durotheca rogersii TaxID=419775 RepID=UPI00221FC8D8|nr:glycosyltransferase family 1 protein [Durotheca rogersii]KAI5863339.1 glycosyltransferase family 1 protein [Durotheca rogersii]